MLPLYMPINIITKELSTIEAVLFLEKQTSIQRPSRKCFSVPTLWHSAVS